MAALYQTIGRLALSDALSDALSGVCAGRLYAYAPTDRPADAPSSRTNFLDSSGGGAAFCPVRVNRYGGARSAAADRYRTISPENGV